MGFKDAFEALGYTLSNHQTDWSAENADGVCITIWKCELSEAAKPHLVYDFGFDGTPPDWTNKVGHTKRRKHVARAVDEFGGKVDVVLLDGPSGGPQTGAHPWIKETRGKGWRITRFNDMDRRHGSFRAEIDMSHDHG
ncbi:hypothetical protein MWU52_11390 [Jannaschia sp. S6380]|uniref:hypothetical protein n=1 Tax=Jannaschia sp. S6380 TaxID=2926408 RepID=UPI001FF13040|nr:hypothetical protein [Jannaschia sp. S6380]MCK0168158.1 hypothetical protein [Jannaschia sp. S6380]